MSEQRVGRERVMSNWWHAGVLPAFERHLAHLKHDFHIDVAHRAAGDAYRLGDFKAFTGQPDHLRHEAFVNPSKIS